LLDLLIRNAGGDGASTPCRPTRPVRIFKAWAIDFRCPDGSLVTARVKVMTARRWDRFWRDDLGPSWVALPAGPLVVALHLYLPGEA
jgi:hypothetical protein